MSLFFYSGGFLRFFNSLGIKDGEGNAFPQCHPVAQLLFPLFCMITFFLTVKKWREVIYLVLQEKFILSILSLAFISAMWSNAPWLTIRCSTALAGTTLFGLYFAVRFNSHDRLIILGWVFGLILLSSILFTFIFPEYGIMREGSVAGSWRCIYGHKNYLGMLIVLAIPTFLLLSGSDIRRRSYVYACFLLSITLLLFTNYKAGFLFTVFILCSWSLYQARLRYYKKMIVGIASALLIFVYLMLHICANFHSPMAIKGFILSRPCKTEKTSYFVSSRLVTPSASTNNNAVIQATFLSHASAATSIESLKTLTGRTQLWSAVFEMIKARPWLGYGYAGFWLGGNSPAGRVWRSIKTWKPVHGHNGILDLWLELGLLGVLVFFIGFFLTLQKTILGIKNKKVPHELFPLVFLTCYLLINLTESILVKHNTIFWVLYVTVLFSNQQRRHTNKSTTESGMVK